GAVERQREVRTIVTEAFDFDEASRRTLGRAWADRTPEERASFKALFVDLLDRAYLRRLDGWDGQRIIVGDEVLDTDRATVRAARRGHLLSEVAAACRQAGARALAVPTDVSQPRQVERLTQSALDAFHHIDVWINNAGVGALGPFERVPLAEHTQVIATTLLGTLYGSYAAYRQFLAQGAGILINVASE